MRVNFFNATDILQISFNNHLNYAHNQAAMIDK